MKSRQAFSLTELLLALAITGIVMLSVYSSFLVGIRSWKTVSTTVDTDAQKLFSLCSKQLRSAYISEKSPELVFNGSLNSLSFISTSVIAEADPDSRLSELQKNIYSYAVDETSGKQALFYERQGCFSLSETNAGKKIIADSLTQIRFAFFDGDQWKNSWSSNTEIPRAVKISADFSRDGQLSSFERIVVLDCFKESRQL